MKTIMINEDKQQILELEDDNINQSYKKSKYKSYWIYISIFFLLITLIYNMHTFYWLVNISKNISQIYMTKLYKYLNNLYEKDLILFLVYIVLIQMFIISFMLPVHLIFSLIIYFIVKNPYYTFLIIYITTIIGTTLVYFYTNYLFKNFIYKKIVNKIKYADTLKLKISQNPYKYTILCKFLTIPLGLKEYILSIFCDFVPFTIGSLFFYLNETFQAVLIGSELNSLNDFFSNKKKITRYSFYIQILLTFFLVLSFIFSLIIAKYIINIIKYDKKLGNF